MTDTSGFSPRDNAPIPVVNLEVDSSTSCCYLVRLYGKLHFMKKLKPELASHPRYRAALQKEFEMGYSLSHPNLVRYVSRGDDYILMDYVDGETLQLFINNNPDYFNDPKNADRFVKQLLSVLGYLHSHHVVHLDLKPQNIVISRIGHDVSLVDLGFCHTDTYPDTPGRTDRYAAPEQFEKNATVDARTDLFAFGRILLEMPCAKRYKKIIAGCTSPAMCDRYRSTQEVLATLNPSKKRHMAVVTMILAIIVTIIVFFILKGRPRTEATTTQPLTPSDTIVVTLPPTPTEGRVPATEPTKPIPADESMTPTPADEPVKTESPTKSEIPPTPATPPPTNNPNNQQSEKQDISNAPSQQSQSDNAEAVHKLLFDALAPAFRKHLGGYHTNYRDMTIEEQHKLHDDRNAFIEEALDIYRQLCTRYSSHYSQHTFDKELESVFYEYDTKLASQIK